MFRLTCLILSSCLLGASSISSQPGSSPQGPGPKVVGKVAEPLKKAVKSVGKVAEPLKEPLKKAVTSVGKVAEPLKEPLKKAVTSVGKVAEDLKEPLKKAVTSVGKVAEDLKEPLKKAVTSVGKVAEPLKEPLKKAVTSVGKVVGKVAEPLKKAVAPQPGSSPQGPGPNYEVDPDNVATGVVTSAGKVVRKVAEPLKKAVAPVVEPLAKGVGPVVEPVVKAADKVTQRARKVFWNDIFTPSRRVFHSVFDPLTAPLKPLVNPLLKPSKPAPPAVKCPPPISPLDKKSFNITEYIRASWYVQQQQTLQYQRIHQLRCVVATYNYNDLSKKATGFIGPVLDVHNYYLGGYRTVNKETGEPISTLCASAIKKATPAWLSVAPCFLNTWFFGGDYWVIKVGINEKYGTYDWAIVSGGLPREQFEDGCTTKSGDKAYQNAGLWIFSRKMKMDPDQLAEARAWLKEQGYTLSQLYPVQQGKPFCGDYPGAYIRTDDY